MRPDFSLEMTIEQFENHYWYKKELEELCRNHGISSAGTKAELIAIYEGPKLIQGPEERIYQWNYFVKEFKKDPLAQGLKQDRMKIAAELWKLVRDAPGDKQYSTTLWANYLKKQEG